MVGLGVLRTYADPDLWEHVRFGLDILESHGLPRIDPYSFTQDVPWVNHEWLSEAIAAWAFAPAGSPELIALKAVLALLSSLLVADALRGAREEWRWGALGLAAMSMLPITYTVRPQLWTLLLLLALCRMLVAAPRYFWLIPVLFAFWVNLHGGWVVGFGVLGVWSIGALLGRAAVRPGTMLSVLLLSVAATLVNPYGVGLWKFILATVRFSRSEIQEWLPIWRDTPSSWILWTCGVVFVVLAWRRRRDDPPLGNLAIVLMLMVASCLVNRIVPLFVPTAVVLLALLLERRQLPAPPVPMARTAFDVGATLLAVSLVAHRSMFGRCIEVDGDWIPDTVAADSLRAAGARGRIVTWFNWGEYAIWHLAPDLKVSFDGRRETIYSDRTIRRQLSIARGDAEGLGALKEMTPEYVWLPNVPPNTTKAWLRRNGYRIDVDTSLSFVAVRQDLQPMGFARSPGTRAVRCFP